MRKFAAGLTLGAMLLIATSIGVACGGMTETAPGVFEGTGKYSGKTYREAKPGEGGTPSFGDDFFEVTYYVELTPSELANMTAEEVAASGGQKAVTGPPPPPPMYKVSPSKVKLTATMPKVLLPEQAKQAVDEEELILA